MKKFWKKVLLSFLTTAALSIFAAQAAPTIASVSVSGYLKRQSGSVVSDGTYPSSIALKSGGVALSGCSDATTTVVQSGYFSKQVVCPALTMSAGSSGNITADVSLTIGGTPESFTVTAYPVPTALVAGTALAVENDTISNIKIAATAGISLSKLNTAGATTGDVIRYDGVSWAYTGLGSLNISTTNLNNNFTAPQAFSGGLNASSATIGTAIVTNETVSGNSTIGGSQTVTGAGTFGSLSILNGVGIAADLAVGGYMSVVGAGTLGALVVSGNAYAVNLAISGNINAATGTIGALSLGTVSSAGGLTLAPATGSSLSLNLAGTGAIHANLGTGTINVTTASTASDGIRMAATGTGGGIVLDTAAGGGAINLNAGTAGVKVNSGPFKFSTQTITSPGNSQYNGTTAAKTFPSDTSVVFITGTTATVVQCIQPGVAGQVLWIIATGAMGVGLQLTHNVTSCVNGHKVINNSTNVATGSTAVASVTASSPAVSMLISSGTAWHIVTRDL